MMTYNVSVVYGRKDEDDCVFSCEEYEEELDKALFYLKPYQAASTVAPKRYSFHITVQALHMSHALKIATMETFSAVVQSDLPCWDVTSVCVTRNDCPEENE